MNEIYQQIKSECELPVALLTYTYRDFDGVLHPWGGIRINFKDNDEVLVSSKYGSAQFVVKINDDIKADCAFFYSGNKNANYLTPANEDESSFSAMYQEVLVEIELS